MISSHSEEKSKMSLVPPRRKISVIIPALNEEESIADVIQEIPVEKLLEKGFKCKILIIDNGSTDRTAEKAQAAGARVVSETKRGYGNAYKRGFTEAMGDIIAT